MTSCPAGELQSRNLYSCPNRSFRRESGSDILLAMRLVLALFVLSMQPATGSALGQVVDGKGEPLREVEIELTRGADAHVLAEIETDSNGGFAMPDLSAGLYHLALSKPSYIPTDLSLQWTEGGIAPFVASMIRFGVVSGRVTGPTGDPVANAAVYAVSSGAESRGERLKQARTASDGTYRLYNLKPGQYRIVLTYGASSAAVIFSGDTKPGPLGSGVMVYPPASESQVLHVAGGDDIRGVDFVISPGSVYRVSGSIPDARQGAEFWIVLSSVDKLGFATAVTITDANGNFSLQGVPPGTYNALVSGPSNGRAAGGSIIGDEPLFGRTQITVESDLDNLTIPVQPGLAASLVMRTMGASEGCKSVELHPAPLEDWAAVLDRYATLTLEHPMPLRDLAPARYRVTAGRGRAECAPVGDPILDLTTGPKNEAVTVADVSAGSLRIVAEPDQWHTVTVLPSDGSRLLEFVFKQHNGQFTYTGLKPGHYRLTSKLGAQDIAVESGKASDVKFVKETAQK